MDVFKLILMQMQHSHSYKVRNLLKQVLPCHHNPLRRLSLQLIPEVFRIFKPRFNRMNDRKGLGVQRRMKLKKSLHLEKKLLQQKLRLTILVICDHRIRVGLYPLSIFKKPLRNLKAPPLVR